MKLTSRRLFAKLLTATAGAAIILGGMSMSYAQEVKRAKLGHAFADSHPRAVAMKQFAAAVLKATDGKVAIRPAILACVYAFIVGVFIYMGSTLREVSKTMLSISPNKYVIIHPGGAAVPDWQYRRPAAGFLRSTVVALVA